MSARPYCDAVQVGNYHWIAIAPPRGYADKPLVVNDFTGSDSETAAKVFVFNLNRSVERYLREVRKCGFIVTRGTESF